MDRNTLRNTQFETYFRKALQTDLTAPRRVESVITDTISSRLYGNVLLCFTEASSEVSPKANPVDAAVAIEFAFLHQYLHTIPSNTDALTHSTALSEYVEETDAAILDGDLLQACAFTRLSAATDTFEMTHRSYRALTQASVECYKRLHKDHHLAVAAPLLGAAARIGSTIGGVDQPTAIDVDEVTRSLADAIPVQLLGEDGSDQTLKSSESAIHATIEKLDTIVSDSVSTTQSLQQLLKETLQMDPHQ